MDRNVETLNFFVAGGPLPPDSPSYAERPADDALFNAVLGGHFCYLFANRHMGKSSLMLRTAWRLRGKGIGAVTADLAGFSTGVSAEQPYLFLIKRLKLQLELSVDPDTWWAEQTSSDVTERFLDFLHDVVLVEVERPAVIFVDGIDDTLDLDFLGGFLAALRFIYDARATDARYYRLAFVLLGTAVLTDLIRGQSQSLLDIGQKIELCEFSHEEAQALQGGLQAVCPESAESIFSRIFYWTNGHPYLTQKLCLATVRRYNKHWTDESIDGLVEGLFLSADIGVESNLRYVEEGIRANRRRRQLLSYYRQVHEENEVPADEQSFEQSRLRLLGLVNAKNGVLKVRNEIYRRAFDLDWVEANMPANWARYAMVVATVIVLVLAGVLGFSIQRQRQRMTQAQSLVNGFWNATSSDKRLANLAGLFNLRGHEDQARRLFYEELSPAEQLALFDLDNPRALGEQLVTVVKGVYTDPNLENNEHNNALLAAMAQPLPQLEYSPSLRSIELELEINQWLKGREYYNSQGPYQRAIDAYNVAIRMNDHNPGTYFDRGLTYVAHGQPNLALADFAAVLNLGESWQVRVKQALINDTQLYMALWDEQREYGSLVALVPTPTNTPTPTATPSPTPLPTGTPLPPTSTATAEPTATFTASPTVTPTSTPVPRNRTSVANSNLTPGVPSGTFTLLNPLSPDDPSYGPTNFEWEWTGPIPQGYGFEVRVWREGEPPAGVHDAVLDSQNGNIEELGGNRYRLSIDIKEAAGVRSRRGVYLWTVALVQVNPAYVDLGQQADPASFRFEAVSLGDEGDDTGGGGGVGID